MSTKTPSSKKEALLALATLQENYDTLQEKYVSLKNDYEELRRLVFQAKSERFVRNSAESKQLKLVKARIKKLEKEIDERVNPVVKEFPTEPEDKTPPSRSRIPKNLRRIVEVIEPTEDMSGWIEVGKEISEQLDYQPATLVVRQYVRPKYVKPQEPELGVKIGDLPHFPIAKGKAGAGLIAKVIVDKYVDHIPLYRQEQRFARQGIHLSRSTLCGWVGQAGKLLQPVYDRLIKQVLNSGYIQADESPIPVLDKKGNGSTHRGYMWVYQAVNEGLVLFDYQPSKEGKVVAKKLENYRGFLQTDGYAAYDVFKSKKKVQVLHCWAHARRYFHKALDTDNARASYALSRIKELYDVESALAKQWNEIHPTHIKDIRQRYSLPVLQEFKEWLLEQLPQVRPKSKIGRAIAYTLKRYKQLSLYAYHGQLRIDNNPVENSIRPLALGRKNYMFAGSHQGARTAAIMYSLLAIAKQHGLNPYTFIHELLSQLPSTAIKNVHKLIPTAQISYTA